MSRELAYLFPGIANLSIDGSEFPDIEPEVSGGTKTLFLPSLTYLRLKTSSEEEAEDFATLITTLTTPICSHSNCFLPIFPFRRAFLVNWFVSYHDSLWDVLTSI